MPQANSYVCYPDFVIRTPLFPLNNLELIPKDTFQISDFIRLCWNDTLIKEAILLASPTLFSQIDKGIRGKNFSDKLINSFIRYFIRMSYRCTPFGLFAGVGTGIISSHTDIRISKPENHLLKCRLDMEYLGKKILKWTANQEIRPKLLYRANTSLYKIGDRWRYIEIYFNAGPKKKYRIVAVDSNSVLDDIIFEAKELRSWKDLIKYVAKWGYDESEAVGFIVELIESQVLIPDIFPNLTGSEFSTRLIACLKPLSGNHNEIRALSSLENMVDNINRPGHFTHVFKQISKLAGIDDPKFIDSHLIQADMQTNFETCEIDKGLSNKALLGIRILKALSTSIPNNFIEDFKSYFKDRFGSRQVPLPIVMDSEFGIGLTGPNGQQMNDPSPLLDGLDFPVGASDKTSNYPHKLLVRKMKSFDVKKSNYIDFSKDDIKELGIRKGSWPAQLYGMIRISGHTDNPSVIFDFASAGNPSNILARFGFLEAEGQINKHIRELTEDDAANYPDRIMAEIVHLPEDRTGNILQRPTYYPYEIVYLASPGGKAEVINPQDIKVSLVNNKIILMHEKMQKIIVPRLTNAHNFRARQLPLYQLLAELGNEEGSEGYFPNWGWFASLNDFLPGIKYENIIISQPRWRVKIDAELKNSKKPRRQLYENILSWVEKNNLPEVAVWTDGDREILIDWSNFNIVMSVWESMKRSNYLFFKDSPFTGGSPVRNTNGHYANEILLCYKKLEE